MKRSSDHPALHTRAGVRNLERELNTICRKVARKVVLEGKQFSEEITAERVTEHLGVPRYRPTLAEKKNEIGVATGLAWTEAGGELLLTESTLMPGKGRLTLTGQLGEVMQESAQAAMSYVGREPRRSASRRTFTAAPTSTCTSPRARSRRTGPSAGITLATALVSNLAMVPPAAMWP